MGGEPVAEIALRKMRALFTKNKPAHREPGEVLWLALDEGERRFVLRASKLDTRLGAQPWSELPEAVRAEVPAAWLRFVAFVARVERARARP